MMVPSPADREAQVEQTCDRTMVDVFRLPHRVKIVVLPDVSLPVSLAIQQVINLFAFSLSPKQRTLTS
jgi:hypothetical protein